MNRYRLGLFQQIYLRAIALVAAALIAMLAYTYVHQYSVLVRIWQEDLQQEADWLAAHSRPEIPHSQITAAWRSMHENVRLQIFDASGQQLADSFEPSRANAMTGRESIEASSPRHLDPLGGELVLSRTRPSAFADQSSVVISALILFLLAAGLMWPLTRQMTVTFGRLSDLAARVSDGQFGATIAEEGDRDLRGLIASFNAMSSKLKDAEQRNHRLLVDVSHEFRSPLARLAALIDTLQRHPEELAEIMARLRGELELLDRLTSDALTDAKFAPATRQLQFEVVDFAPWADSVFARLSAGGRGFSGRFILQNMGGAGRVEIDSQGMMQVLGNLVDNARKALAGHSAGTIMLDADIDNTTARLRVRDNGPGIDDADLPFVTDRFYRAGGQPSDSEGSGLGLSIAREIVLAHDGELLISSPPGGGFVAEIRLPLSTRGGDTA